MPTTLEIHPAIGIARVGSSEEFFIGPEPDHASPASYRDGAGQLKRQAARFRVFECERDEQGRLIGCTECTPDTAVITWEMHSVDRKAAAPFFLRPQSNQPNTNPTLRRNNATGQDQASPDRDLIIDPGPRSLMGANQGPTFFDTGTFRETIVELWGDTDGRTRSADRGRRFWYLRIQATYANPALRRQPQLARRYLGGAGQSHASLSRWANRDRQAGLGDRLSACLCPRRL